MVYRILNSPKKTKKTVLCHPLMLVMMNTSNSSHSGFSSVFPPATQTTCPLPPTLSYHFF